MLVPLYAVVAALQATQPSAPAVPLSAASVAATRALQAPSVNGRDDDPVWRSAPKTTGFRQFEPHVNSEPTFRTEFQVAYDARNFYVFVRMHDPHPDSIMHALSRRDVRGPSDQIKLLIDSYDDKRSGYELAVNPDGVKRDYSISNDGNEDESWNGVWDVATTVDAEGWTAEFRVPLSQLRYAGTADHTFGFGIWRDIERLNEREAWPEYSPTRNGLASQLGRLTGLAGISSARHAELTPYAVTKNQQRVLPNAQFNRDQQLTVGADIKVGITPNVTLDATVNPDFGQVEADPAVLNLTAFETFVAEQRPFFVEGTGLYQFQLNCYIVVDCQTNEGLFYSRRIGRSPSLRGVYGDARTANSTPIATAGKLTGRTQSGLSFGALEALTPRVAGPNARTVEPATSYSVLRVQQDLRGGETGLSLIATAVDRSLDTLSAPFLHRAAYVTGASFRNRFHKQQYELVGQVAMSQVKGSPLAIARTQRSPVHYYQQPGDDATVDTTRQTLSGHAEQLKFGKYGGGITRFETSVVRQSAGFEVNDLGYLRRADVTDWSTWAALSFRNARGIYRWAQANVNHWERWNTSGTRLDDAVNVNGHMGFKNNWNAHLGGTLGGLRAAYCDRCTRGGPTLRSSRGFYPWGGINSDSRQSVSGGAFVNFSSTDEGHSHGASWSPYINLRMSPRLQLNVGTGYSTNHDDAQWYGNFADGVGATHYAFAHLDQRTVSMNMRLNYTVTPALSFEFYGQPFVATGEYSNVREVSGTPHANSYGDRFRPFAAPAGAPTEFRYTQLRTNTVARWEYRPGSTLFVVWAHGREDFGDQNLNHSWSQDYRDLFRLHPDNTFLIKVAYWLNR
ncbi:MAG: carbohydrate binding family 9 domain-containing protein [Gemmatimonadaceae bacterium]|nr:carbohydrate binding family 9 domain-containing protein [Gemmatimonadaceae bacterium]